MEVQRNNQQNINILNEVGGRCYERWCSNTQLLDLNVQSLQQFQEQNPNIDLINDQNIFIDLILNQIVSLRNKIINGENLMQGIVQGLEINGGRLPQNHDWRRMLLNQN